MGMQKDGFWDFHAVKGSHRKIASCKLKGQNHWITGFELHPHHFAIHKSDLVKNGMGNVGVGKVATFKSAFHKILIVQKSLGEQAVHKTAILIITLRQFVLRIILLCELLIEPKGLCHYSSDRMIAGISSDLNMSL